MTAVRELMTEGILTCPPDAPPTDIAGLLVHQRVHAVFVLDDDGRPRGWSATPTDRRRVARRWGHGPAAMRGVTARRLMSAPVLMIDADADVIEAAARLVEEHVGRLLVVEDERHPGCAAGVRRRRVDRRPSATAGDVRAGHVSRDRGQPAGCVDRRRGARDDRAAVAIDRSRRRGRQAGRRRHGPRSPARARRRRCIEGRRRDIARDPEHRARRDTA